ncbi:hypothetical protein QJS10_CPA03g01013 [Acorus calamus]|uniref:Uncharacterized protein n=1 Tax=Acorus calamus TaxID=4465 RepID=A0AAV9F9M3_ACOCL|nr:hypothetical protein QJS10_CPA03g01013 [Acorus calamus]
MNLFFCFCVCRSDLFIRSNLHISLSTTPINRSTTLDPKIKQIQTKLKKKLLLIKAWLTFSMAYNTNNTTTPPPSNHVPIAGIVVVDARYCSPEPVDLTIAGRASGTGDYAVTDDKGNLVFKVDGVRRRSEGIMYDVGGNPILSMRRKVGLLSP